MSTMIVCDGCRTAVAEGEFKRLGVVVTKDYCPTCAVIVEDYLADRDTLHTQLAQEWSEGVESLRQGYNDRLDGGTLPDEL